MDSSMCPEYVFSCERGVADPLCSYLFGVGRVPKGAGRNNGTAAGNRVHG